MFERRLFFIRLAFRSQTFDNQHRQVIALFGFAYKRMYRRQHRLYLFLRFLRIGIICLLVLKGGQSLQHPLFAELLIVDILRLGQTVCIEEERIAMMDRCGLRRVRVAGKDT